MMFVIHALDKPLSPLRSQLIDEHRQYLSGCPFDVLQSGPLMDDMGEIMIGSLIIVDCSAREDVDISWQKSPLMPPDCTNASIFIAGTNGLTTCLNLTR